MNENGDLRIDIERFGPGPEVIEEVSQAALNHPSVQRQLSETRHRLLSVRLLTPAVEDKPDAPVPPDRYRATIYDYTNNRVVLATGRLDDIQGSIEVSEAGYQPLPNRDEFDEAVEILLEDDGVADTFGRGDVWILRFNEGQVDDGISAAPSQAGASQANAPADINRFANGESISNQDVVVWYAAHFTHDVHEDEEEEVGHIVGPVLLPVNW
jgi:hypothetical protein